MIKLFISDLDGTLIYKPKQGIEPNEENIKAVKNLRDNNIEFAVATGRFDKHILDIEKYVDSRNYRIGMNGGTIYDKENNLIWENTFDFNDIKTLKENIENDYIKKINFMVLLTTNGERFIKYSGPLKRMTCFRYEKKFNALVYPENILSELKEKDTKILKAMVNTRKAKKYSIEKDLKEKFSDFEVTISGPHSIEIGPKGNTKGEAIKKIMRKENLTRNEVAFIGDSYNDLSAFEVCGHSFAMSHADGEIKSRARYVTKSVAEAVKEVIKFNNRQS
mgnify:CR=1 FL=1